jgi:glutamate dehydrogenase
MFGGDMDCVFNGSVSLIQGAEIIEKAESVGLDPRVLYEAVIDLSSQGLITASSINMAAGIILHDLGLPNYFFEHITSSSLSHLLESIATSIKRIDDKVILYGRVAHIDFDLEEGSDVQRIRIATQETRDNMESVIEGMIFGHRREYYYSPESNYYTYIIRPGTINDVDPKHLEKSPFLFSLSEDFSSTPEPTRKRYERFREANKKAVTPLIQFFNLPETGETRLMFNTDFYSPELPILRQILADHDLTLVRAYWEPYFSAPQITSSICALYVQGELSRSQEDKVAKDITSFLSFAINPIKGLYVNNVLSFHEMLFAGNAIDFTNLFIYKESANATDREIINSLKNEDHQDAFAKRIWGYNISTYRATLIEETVRKNPDLIKILYGLFERRFDPASHKRITEEELAREEKSFDRKITSRFMDFPLGQDIFTFMFKIVSCTLKTNFYKAVKRSFSFRFDNRILDPVIFNQFVFGIFYVTGHYACGSHMRAGDISRGGLRLIRVSSANHEAELDKMVLLNYALGPKAQRLKHKDICESGSKGVVVPHPQYARYSLPALYDYTEGILDLMLMDDSIVDYYKKPEMIFFGPDEGTAPLMDAVALRSKERGYVYWRTLTTGKSFGIPHDAYGMLESGQLFGLFDRGEEGVELQLDDGTSFLTNNMEDIYEKIGGKVRLSGMTTTSVMSSFRMLISFNKENEEDLNLMMTGGPDGDLGANQIQCYKGKICLIIDGGSILFDPEGLDKKELTNIGFMRNSSPRVNSLAFDDSKLSNAGFKVPLDGKNIELPDGTMIEDGTVFHRNFLSDPANRKYIEAANIRVFIPCGGFKDTINLANVDSFLSIFKELEYIVEGANVFFDDGSRRHIATSTKIQQIKDSSANKGGVFSSSIAEILTAFLLGDDYEEKLLDEPETRWGLIRDVMLLVEKYAGIETDMLLHIHEIDTTAPLFALSEITSEEIFILQDLLEQNLDTILKNKDLVWAVMDDYIPEVLRKKLGREHIMSILNSSEMQPYRDAILTKKIASMAFYKYFLRWQEFLEEVDKDLVKSIEKVVG